MSKPFDIFTSLPELNGRSLIEASAGTGKTYNISGLFVRLVAENQFGCAEDVSRIVVVTYTKAATKELKQRITQRLRDSHQVLTGNLDPEETTDDFLKQVHEQYQENSRAQNHLRQVLGQIDQLSVFTIHSFAQRLLQEFGPQASIDYTGEIITDPTEVTNELVYDYWRRLVAESDQDIGSQILLQLLRSDQTTPEKFIETYGDIITDTQMEFRASVDLDHKREEWRDLNARMRTVADGFSDEIKAEFRTYFYSEEYNLSKTVFKPEKWEEFDGYFTTLAEAELITDLSESEWKNVGYFGYPDGIDQKCNKGLEPEDLPLSSETKTWMQSLQEIQQLATGLYEEQADITQTVLQQLHTGYQHALQERDDYTYDDLLYMADQMVQQHPQVREAIRTRYPISLIDEFQDTDPLQWSIFKTLYPTEVGDDSLLCLIGDPKQSIYKFRGADIYSYLAARDQIPEERHFTLDANYRSDQAFIEAQNQLWHRHEDAFFIDDQISYSDVQWNPERTKQSPLAGTMGALHWIVDENENDEAELNKSDAQERAAHITAQHIQQTLERGGSQISPSDIAVLCNSNKEAALIKRTLFEYGLNSVQLSRDNVFESKEARELQLILEAVVDPGNAYKLRAALGTRILNGQELLLQLRQQEEPDADTEQAWEQWLMRVLEWHQLWSDRGFTPMLRRWLEQGKCEQHLLAYHDGERRVTNMRHLIDLLQEMARQRPGEPHYLLHELQQRRHTAGDHSSSEEEELRLENDRDLINVVTIHRSKGLEYPIVYTPFLWSGINTSQLWRRRPYIYHNPQNSQQKLLDIDGKQIEGSKFHFFREEMQDKLRVAYVALTRGEHHNIVISVPYQHNYQDKGDSAYSPLDYILFGRERFEQGLRKKYKEYISAENTNWITYSEVPEAVANVKESMSHEQMTFESWSADSQVTERSAEDPAEKEKLALQHRSFEHKNQLIPSWSIRSYSALGRGLHGGSEDELAAFDVKMDEVESENESAQVSSGNSMFSFPRGARTGLCWHKMYEEFTFDDPDTYTPVIERELESHGFDPRRWLPVLLKHVQTTMQKELLPIANLRLGDLSPVALLPEMEFHFQYAQANAREIMQLVRPHEADFEDAPLPPGLMKGFIDLTFEHQGKIYLLDYKSNHLGNTFDDYQTGALAESIREHHYDLQYHLYTLALHRYLKLRKGSSYSYNKHFGGAFYLFLRGVQPGEATTGIYFERPDYEIIQSLDHYFNHEVQHA
ncbi:MAG: exodeoxyribonuclease V subunit beta [Bacteroidota bacterium]